MEKDQLLSLRKKVVVCNVLALSKATLAKRMRLGSIKSADGNDRFDKVHIRLYGLNNLHRRRLNETIKNKCDVLRWFGAIFY